MRLICLCTILALLELTTRARAASPDACLMDLQAIPGFLLRNDTGAQDELARLGRAHFDEALRRAKAAATDANGDAACTAALNDYLQAWRHGHLVDRGCGSSCEQFLLTVRQSFIVKLVGQPSRGSLDYSNLRPYDLPSRNRILLYATSRSDRLPDFPVDVTGVQPDIYLPDDSGGETRTSMILRVERWLGGGSMSPTDTRFH